MDFTLKTFKLFLESLSNKTTNYYPIIDYLKDIVKTERENQKSVILLRHDIDLISPNALKIAQIENEFDICGSYYFRILPVSYNFEIMRQIADMGHEIGYHYEDMDLMNGDVDKAFESFKRNLEKFRKIYPIETICMHGSPRSKYDNRDLWKKYDYKSLGIIGEPYYDINFKEVLYLTDTGRRWNGSNVSVRDKVDSGFDFNFKSTFDIINSIDKLPDKVMLTFHPQRWNNNYFAWGKELVLQNVKNLVKRSFYVGRNSRKK